MYCIKNAYLEDFEIPITQGVMGRQRLVKNVLEWGM
ncbi:MAG: hypothetical protein CM15mP122_5740 [Bacteroidota bacterium]|nr:MAG: hypothetical protein CM15mP122_5740 [Bacteroidota bacterium]